MAFERKEIVPWGRSFAEYVSMFALSEEDLDKHILGCGDGSASFNSELSKRGGTVVSVDPLYAYDEYEIKKRIEETFDDIMRETLRNSNEFVWKHVCSIDELGELRMKAMREFLLDFPQGKIEGRYIPESTPFLSSPENSFDLGVCSHFLFLYSEHLDLDFHVDSITELGRVCRETRIFPLLQLGTTLSPHVAPVSQHFLARGYEVTQVDVPYEFQRSGNQMLRIRKI